MLWRLAFLSVVKHRRRSLVVIMAVGVAVAVMTLIAGIVQGAVTSFYEGMIADSGHVRLRNPQVDKALDPLSPKLLLTDRANLENQVRQAVPTAQAVESILTFRALLINENSDDSAGESKNQGVIVYGVGPKTAFFDRVTTGLVEGSFLSSDDGIVIGASLAKLLGVSRGAKLLTLVQDVDGASYQKALPIVGIFRTESQGYDETTAFVRHGLAEELLNVDGKTRELRVLLTDRNQAKSAAAAITATLSPNPVEVRDWETTQASTLSLLTMITVITGFIRFLFVVIAITIITNSILTSVFERVREFGTLRAIGLKRRQENLLIVMEGAFLGLAGSLAGLALGLIAVTYLHGAGLDMGGMMEGLGLARQNRATVDLGIVGFNLGVGCLIALVASLYAARTVSRLSVVQSLTHL